MLEPIRRKLFWSMDSLKGGRLKAHYDDIAFVLANLESTTSINRRLQCLNQVLQHAVDSTPYYKNLANFKGLEDFEVIDKNVIREHYEDFKSSLYKNRNNYCAFTSGSTGTPFKLMHDRNKRIRNSADVIYFAKQAGYEIGQKLYYIRLWDKYNRPNPWIARMKNIYMHSVSKLSRSDLATLLRNMSKDTSNKGIICYASILDELKKHIEKEAIKPIIKNVNSIIAISEPLKLDAKESMEEYFGVPVVSRYSNVENGILAQQLLNSTVFQINWASYYIEILNLETNTPAKPGELGRIVITDLYNYCMPMIRYDTGDVGQFAITEKNGVKHTALKKIEGRKMEMIYDTNGEMKSPFIVYHLMKYPHILQYQFIQEDRTKYRVKLNVLPEFTHAKEIVAELKKHLGSNAIISLEYVDDIPLLSSGKRKFVINEYKQNTAFEEMPD